MDKKEKQLPSRRDFLKTAGMGAGVAAVAGAVLSPAEAMAKPNLQDNKSTGYRETEHIRKYYELARN